MICVRPWFGLHVWGDVATCCCYAPPFTHYPSFQATVDYNCPALQEFRAKMLLGDHLACCPTCPHTKSSSVEQQIEYLNKQVYPSNRWDAVKSCIESKSVIAPPPIYVSAMTGTKCNSNCKMCYRQTLPLTGKNIVMPVENRDRLKSITKDADWVHFGGGDLFALTDDEIDNFLALVPNANVEVTTNAQGLSTDRINKYILTGLIKSLNISLETISPELYKLHCGRDIGDLLDRLRYLDGKSVRWYSCVLTEWTILGLTSLPAFAKETHVKTLVIKPPVGTTLEDTGYPRGDIIKNGSNQDLLEVLSILDRVENLCKNKGIYLSGLDQSRAAIYRRTDNASGFRKTT